MAPFPKNGQGIDDRYAEPSLAHPSSSHYTQHQQSHSEETRPLVEAQSIAAPQL